MTVRDLMEILTAFDPDMKVLVREPFDGNGPESWEEPRVVRSMRKSDRSTDDDTEEHLRIEVAKWGIA